MLYLTKKEIDKKFFQVISSYEKVLSSLNENKYSDISYNLDNIRFLNSEIQCMVKEFAILDKNKSFKDETSYITRVAYNFDKDVEKKINNFNVKIFNYLKIYQDNNTKNKVDAETLARVYIQRYIPLAWNKEIDVLFIANLNNTELLTELIAYKQKNIVVLDQNVQEVNEFIERKKNKNIILTNDFLEEKVKILYRNANKLSQNLNNDIWFNFPYCFKNKYTQSDFEKDKKNLEIFRYGKNSSISAFYWIKNGLKNLNYLNTYPNIKFYYNKFSNKSAIIICPGPSLEEDIKYLKNLKNKVLICAVAHALPALQKYDIIPDIVIHADCLTSEWVESVWKNYDFSKINLLILSATSDNRWFKKSAKKFSWFFSNNAFDKWLNDLLGISNTILHAVGVAHVSLSILNRMGFKNIGFLGLDHSFKGNNFFAKSSGTSSNNKHWNTGELQKWPSKNVGTVTTNQKFIKSINVMERLIESIKNKSNVNLFNCSSEGALIKGFINVGISEFIKRVNTEHTNFEELLIHKMSIPKNLEYNKKENISESLKKLYKDLIYLCEGTKTVNNLYSNNNFSDKNLIKLKNANTLIMRVISNNNILVLVIQKYLEDYNQRKVFNRGHTEIFLQKKLYLYLHDLFQEFKNFIEKNNLIKNY